MPAYLYISSRHFCGFLDNFASICLILTTPFKKVHYYHNFPHCKNVSDCVSGVSTLEKWFRNLSPPPSQLIGNNFVEMAILTDFF